jgi:hypothetical protein
VDVYFDPTVYKNITSVEFDLSGVSLPPVDNVPFPLPPPHGTIFFTPRLSGPPGPNTVTLEYSTLTTGHITYTAPAGEFIVGIGVVTPGPRPLAISNILLTALPQSQLSLSLSNQQVYPAGTSGNSETTVSVQLTTSGGSPLPGKEINFSANPKEFSGGHNHSGNRLSGEFDFSSCTTDVNGICSVNYMASELGGVESIIGTLSENSGVSDSKDLTVGVPSLIELANGSPFYRLTGETNAHLHNHFLASEAFGIFSVVSDFYDEFSATLGLNDMSLQLGGLFDILGQWTSPHSLHREGRSVDIDRCALSVVENNPNEQGSCPNGWIQVPRMALRHSCEDWGGRLVIEATYHCEF